MIRLSSKHAADVMTGTIAIHRVMVIGSPRWTDTGAIRRALLALKARHGDGLVVFHRACPVGTDRVADAECRSLEIVAYGRPADWDNCGNECPETPHRLARRAGNRLHPGTLRTYCPNAGSRRDAAMVAAGGEEALAFPLPDSIGTRHCIDLVRGAGIRVDVWPTDGNCPQLVGRGTAA